MKNASPRAVYLRWYDHWGMGGGWRDINELKDGGPSICHSVGWLVREDRLGYYLSSGMCPESGAPHTLLMYVLKSAVIKKKWLSGISLEA